jgi:hypothetical protein
MLRNKGLTRQVTTVPLSAGLLADTDAYFAAPTTYREGDAAPIVERFSQASILAIANGSQLVADLRGIPRHGTPYHRAVRLRGVEGR